MEKKLADGAAIIKDGEEIDYLCRRLSGKPALAGLLQLQLFHVSVANFSLLNDDSIDDDNADDDDGDDNNKTTTLLLLLLN